jgi:hypothetical protein
MNMMRQVAAISVQAFALTYLLKAQREHVRIHWLGVITLIVFSVTLHSSSIVLLPVFVLPFITKRKHWRTAVIVLSVIAAICVFAFPFVIKFATDMHLLSERQMYALQEYEGSLMNLKFVGSLVLACVAIANYHRRGEAFDKQMSLLMLVGVSYSAIGFYSAYLGRLSMLFWIFIIMYAFDILCQVSKKESHRVAACLSIAIGYFVVYFCVLGFNELMPYSFAF